jgi:hypothetical protein
MDGGGIGMNTAGLFGGGLANFGGTVVLDQNLGVGNNTAANNGGGLYFDNTSNTTLNSITVQGNKSTGGAGPGVYQQMGGKYSLSLTNLTDNDDPGKGPVFGP